jgi:hypothetical protein
MEEIYRSQFRMPYSLYESLKAAADKNRRSVNAELIARLEEGFEREAASAEQPARMSFKVDRDKLLSGIDTIKGSTTPEDDRPVTISELSELLAHAMSEVMNEIRGAPPKPGTSTTGPRPRKRFPKE